LSPRAHILQSLACSVSVARCLGAGDTDAGAVERILARSRYESKFVVASQNRSRDSRCESFIAHVSTELPAVYVINKSSLMQCSFCYYSVPVMGMAAFALERFSCTIARWYRSRNIKDMREGTPSAHIVVRANWRLVLP
jgi:hypothetical protein